MATVQSPTFPVYVKFHTATVSRNYFDTHDGSIIWPAKKKNPKTKKAKRKANEKEPSKRPEQDAPVEQMARKAELFEERNGQDLEELRNRFDAIVAQLESVISQQTVRLNSQEAESIPQEASVTREETAKTTLAFRQAAAECRTLLLDALERVANIIDLVDVCSALEAQE
ncbi:hypothetical protein EBZ39_16725 [bacterium]|nr:hypothetical protein [bacterium]